MLKFTLLSKYRIFNFNAEKIAQDGFDIVILIIRSHKTRVE